MQISSSLFLRFICRKATLSFLLLLGAVLSSPSVCLGQSLGNAGAIRGTVLDPSGAIVVGADVSAANSATGYTQTTKTQADGSFQLPNLPFNPYRLTVDAQGFAPFTQNVDVRGTLPVELTINISLAGASASINVAENAIQVELTPSAHVDTNSGQLDKLPLVNPGAGLSSAITYSAGGVVADSNGFFHPLGDHSEATFIIDGQPISDQQSKVFSTQLPLNAVESMELDTGAMNAEFGDKTSLVAQVTTKSGLSSQGFFGNVEADYGSFGSPGGNIGLGWGNEKFGNYLAVDGMRSGRFLDTPQFFPIHDIGNNQTYFDRIDFQLTPNDALHLNLFAARNWIQIPNSLDQIGQDQRQKVVSWSIAPGYQHIFSPHVLLTVNPYVRKDQFEYFPSSNPFADSPATQSQNRHLFNWGLKSDLAVVSTRHNLKIGIDLKQTRLFEQFNFGITDPAFNAPCLDLNGNPITDSSVLNPACTGLGQQPNSAFLPGLLPFDLSRGGALFGFLGRHNINQYAFYVQDAITLGNLQLTLGLRGDLYYGLSSAASPEPRVGLAYNVKDSGTVLRAAFSRTFETPFNENLLLSSSTGMGGFAQNFFGATAAAPIQPGHRNQFNAGFQQTLGRWLMLDADYFWKFTDNAFDFNTLLNSTITFPVSWHNSKLDGLTARLSTTNIHGFQAYWSVGHTRARFFPPENGGLLSIQPSGPFRIDHDQAFQSTANFHYQPHPNREWIGFTWRFDSGMVVSGVPDAGAALGLTPNQQVTLGLACNGVFATVSAPLRDCVKTNGAMGRVTSTLITVPQGGYGPFPSQENDDRNPDRVRARNLFDVGVGTDNLIHHEGKARITASLTIANLTNKVALYNFLSTFSGTHFVQPRSYVGRLGFEF